MAKMQRPAWTIAFGFICVLVVPGAILTHMSVAELIPSIEDLPANLVKGFDQVFRFAYLEQDSKDVKAASALPLQECGVANAKVTCKANMAPDPMNPAQQKSINTTTAKVAIKHSFANSLTIVSKIAEDKYFGTSELKETANSLNKITAEFNKVKTSMKCYEAIPTFCTIYESSDSIVTGIAEVQKAINTFKTSDIVTRGGTKLGSCALLPSVIFWLVSFVIYLVVAAVGISVKYMADKMKVPVLNGSPTLDLAIKHVQKNYPEFWNVVFHDMEDGLDGLLLASFFVVAACVLQSIYSSCEICCCPYRKKADSKEQTAEPVAQPPAQLKEQPAAEKQAENVEAQAPVEESVAV